MTRERNARAHAAGERVGVALGWLSVAGIVIIVGAGLTFGIWGVGKAVGAW